MNLLIIKELKKEHQRIELVRYDGKTTYINCIDEFEYSEKKLQEVIQSTKFGDIKIADDKIIVCKKIKNT